jgi:heme/copper-type cytochrome/quinol oxidase subunit 2
LFGFALVVVIRWLIACSQLCGLGHYGMRGYYAVQSDADFNAWFAEETALLTEP